MRKREIACYKQFLLFSQCFPQLYIFSVSKCGIVWQLVNTLASALTETSILYTDRHMDGRTDRVIPVYPQKTFVLQGYNKNVSLIFFEFGIV